MKTTKFGDTIVEPNTISGKTKFGDSLEQLPRMTKEERWLVSPETVTAKKIQEREDITALSTKRHNQFMAQYYRKIAAKMPDEKPIINWPKTRITGMTEYLPTKKEQMIKKAEWYTKGAPRRKISPTTPEAIGGTIGGIAGLTVGHPYLGAFLGGAAGKSIQQIKQALTASEEAPKTSTEAALGMGKAGGIQAGVEFVTGLPFRGSRAIPKEGTKFFGRPISRAITPSAEKAQAYFAKYGGRLTPGQVSDKFWIDLSEGASESAIIGGGTMRKFKLAEKQIAENMVDTIARRLGTDVAPDVAGRAGQDLIKDSRSAFRATENQMYKAFDDLSEGTGISIKRLQTEAKQLGGKIRPLVKTGEEVIPSNILDQFGKPITEYTKDIYKNLPAPAGMAPSMGILDSFVSLPEKLPASYLQEWRKVLSQKGFPGAGELRTAQEGLSTHFKNLLDDAFIQAEKSGELSTEALNALKAARTFSAQGHKVFGAKITESLLKNNPEFFLSTLAQSKSITDVRLVKGMVGADFDRVIRPRYITDILTQQAKMAKTGETSGAAIKSILHPKKGVELVKEILGSSIYDELDTLAEVLVRQQAKPPMAAGRMAVMLRQPGALIQILGGGGVAYGRAAGSPATQIVSGSLVLAPPVLSRLFSSKIGIALVTKGITTDATTREGADIAARILQIIGNDIALTAKERQSIKEQQSMP